MLSVQPEDAARLASAAQNIAALPSAGDSAWWPPIVCYDECAADRRLKAMLHRRARDATVHGITPLWWETRLDQAGQDLQVWGGAPAGRKGDLDFGVRISGDSWPDVNVVDVILSNLAGFPSVVVLTADRGKQPDGLLPLLSQYVAPTLNADLSHGRSLVVLPKRPKTSIDRYVRYVDGFLNTRQLPIGFYRRDF